MAEIFPFRGYRYNPGRVELDKVLTQPYDKITAEMQERYYAQSPYNLISVEKGRAAPGDTPQNSVYTRAARALEDWIAAGVLVQDAALAGYVYSQEYKTPGSEKRLTRKGFIALGRLHDYADGVVFPHERTHSGPKADRLELLRHTRTHTGQLFMLYADPQRRVDALLDEAAARPPGAELRDEFGTVHRLWLVSEPAAIQRLQSELAGKKLVIADGHHRYETALAYRSECRARGAAFDPEAPHEKVMMTLFNVHSEGLTILPTHRLVSSLPGFDAGRFREQMKPYFEWSVYPFRNESERRDARDEFLSDLLREGERHSIGVYAGDGAYYLFRLGRNTDMEALLADVSVAQRQLDVVLLHRVLLEKGLGISAQAVVKEQHIAYERVDHSALAAVDEGRAQVCFLLNAARVEQVLEIALGGEVLPQKSTDFYPKLLSGLVNYRLED